MWSGLVEAVTSHPAWYLGQAIGEDLFAEPDERQHAAGQVATIVTVVTVGIVAVIGILVYDQVDSTITVSGNTHLSRSASNVTGGFGDAMDLIPIVLLVLVASLVIAVVQQF